MDKAYKKLILIESAFVFLFLALLILYKIGFFGILPNCTFREHFGVICPFCGGTRAVLNLINLKFIDAFKYHPSAIVYAFIVFLGNLIYIIETIFYKKSRININLFLISFYIFIALTIVQYIIRLFLIYKGMDMNYLM